MDDRIYQEYQALYLNLRSVAQECNAKILDENSDSFFVQNTNYLTKSFLVNICAYLESYIRDLVYQKIEDLDTQLSACEIPYNLVRWSLQKKDLKDSELKFENFHLNFKKRDLDAHISGNPSKTKRLFKWIGVDLDDDEAFLDKVELIGFIVQKRNSILHHNDTASDVSIADIIQYIDFVLEYMQVLYQAL